jgi:hypothetical protein
MYFTAAKLFSEKVKPLEKTVKRREKRIKSGF